MCDAWLVLGDWVAVCPDGGRDVYIALSVPEALPSWKESGSVLHFVCID